MVVIPFAEFPAFTEEVVLDNTPYRFQFIWNYRGQYWSLSIFDRELAPKVQAIKVVVEYELLKMYHALDVPPGELYTTDTTEEVQRIERETIQNGDVELVYIPEAEL